MTNSAGRSSLAAGRKLMSPNKSKTILILTRPTEEDLEEMERERGPAEEVAKLVEKTLNVDQARRQFQAFIAAIQDMLTLDQVSAGPFNLQQIQFSAELSANGEFKLLGTGVGAEASAAITFVLERKEE
jgi:hypothetical protein